jgi:protoporphyrinogen oxidase
MDIIIGAGVSGIAYAGFTDSDYMIIEAENEIGGYCRTIKQDGFTWDYSGHFFHFQNKELEKQVCSHINPDDILKIEKQTQIKYKNKYIDYPFQKNIHQLAKPEFVDCLYDLFTVSQSDFSTFKQMLYAKFGKSIAEFFLIPYNEKLYACDLDILDVDAMGRFFPYANKEDIILNFKKTKDASYNSYFIYPKGGAIEYINSLFERVNKDNLSLNESVCKIDFNQRTVITNKRELKYDRLISTMPFPNLLEMCGMDYDRSIYSWNKVLVFNLGFDSASNDKTNQWIYIPGKDCIFYRVGYYNNIFKSAKMSLYVELGFNKDTENINVDECLEKVIIDLKRCGIITTQKLISDNHILMNPAYVHINKKSTEDVCRRKEILSKNEIYSIGRYGSWTYCSIEDNIIEAKKLSEKLNGISNS